MFTNSFHLKFSLVVIVLFFIIGLQAQVLYQGHISDVAGYESVSNVSIELLEGGLKTLSNSEGNFVFLDPDIKLDTTNILSGNFITQGNILVWSFNTNFDIRIYSETGALHFSTANLPKNGYLSLDGFRNGIFFIRISSGIGQAGYKLLSVDQNFVVSETQTSNKSRSVGRMLTDTMYFRKSDYFPLKIPVVNNQVSLNIKMLKRSYDELHFFNELLSEEAFTMISSTPSKSHMGEVSSVKVIYDVRDDLLYYMNTKIHTNHYDFARSYMEYPGSRWTFNNTQYQNVSNRYLFPATLNYYSGLDTYTIEFFSGDGATCEEVYDLYHKILSTSYFNEKLFFYSTNESWSECAEVQSITPNELYAGQNYQALNISESYGYLRKLDVEQLDETFPGRHEIVVLNGIPFDIPVVAGIITTEFQTPLSHINVLSHNRGTPNMALRDALTNPKLDSLFGKLVYLNVESDSFTLRSASYEEATIFWNATEPSDTVYLQFDIGSKGLVNLAEASIADVERIGGKAANFAELLNAFPDESIAPPVPEEYFAIPFHYYFQHISRYGLDKYISDFLKNPDFYTNAELRAERLKILRDSIINSPLEDNLLDLVNQRLGASAHFTSFRFRSSTNAEDLEGFNGAGLYASFTGKVNDASRPVDEAIKKVWASLWNFRAFEERDYFKISHENCMMGVLVHRSFPDEEANGVAITRNLYNSNHGFIINVQFGEHSIVEPDPGILHDQIILYLYSLTKDEPFTFEYIGHSNIPENNRVTVLSKEELFQLGEYLKIIKTYFYNAIYSCNCNYEDFGLDIEFKVDSELSDRKIYIKQVRPY